MRVRYSSRSLCEAQCCGPPPLASTASNTVPETSESAVLLYHHKGDEMRYNATLREIFGDDHFYKAPIHLEMDFKQSSESVTITCIGEANLTVLDNRGQKVVIAPGDRKNVYMSRKRAYVSIKL